jgi:hypothetical protein
MLARQMVLEQLDAYLNGRLSLEQLVDWAEKALIEPDIPVNEDADLLMDVVAYLGAADSRAFPLTWEVLTGFLERLGGSVRVIVDA